VREEVQLDTASSQNGVPAVELVRATFETKALVERNSVAHRAAGQYWDREIVWLHGHWVVGFATPNEQRLSDAAAMVDEGTVLHGVR